MIKYHHWLVAALFLQLGACTNTSNQDLKDTESAPPPQETTATDVSSRPFPAESFHDLLVAEFAVRRNQFDIALGHYLHQAHQTRDPGVTSRATRLAQFVKADKAALDAAQLWIDIEPDNLEAQYTTATMLAKNKQPIEALKHMATVLEQGGKTNFTAIAASALNQPKLSQEVLLLDIEKLIVKHPNHSQLYISRAILEQSKGEREKALASTRKGIDLDSTNIQAVVIETRLLQELGRNDEAFTRLQKVLKQNPHNRRLRLQYARLLLKKDIAEARIQFKILLDKAPKDPDFLISLSLISTELNDNEQARGYLDRLLATGIRNNEAHYYLAQLAEREKNIEEAITHYQAITPGNDYMAATNRIAELYVTQNQPSKAQEFFKSRRQQQPQLSLQLYLLEAELLLKLKELDKCHDLLTEALSLHPQQANLLYMRSLVSEKRNDIALMETDLRNILKQNPNNATALNALGYILANRSEKIEEAYKLIKRALELKPNDPAILDSLGWVQYRRGKLEEASALLARAYKFYPDPEVAAHFGEVLWQQQQYEKAQKIWQQGLKKSPNHPVLKETMARMLATPADTEAQAEPQTDSHQEQPAEQETVTPNISPEASDNKATNTEATSASKAATAKPTEVANSKTVQPDPEPTSATPETKQANTNPATNTKPSATEQATIPTTP